MDWFSELPACSKAKFLYLEVLFALSRYHWATDNTNLLGFLHEIKHVNPQSSKSWHLKSPQVFAILL